LRERNERRPLAEAGLIKAIDKLTTEQGPDWAEWLYSSA
jgi:hypothetical protein